MKVFSRKFKKIYMIMKTFLLIGHHLNYAVDESLLTTKNNDQYWLLEFYVLLIEAFLDVILP